MVKTNLIVISLIICLVTLVKNNNVLLSETSNSKIPRIIWLFWEGKMPDEVPYTLNNIKRKMDNYNIIFLCNATICNYININTLPSNLHTLPIANVADYYRFKLLYEYGGIWLDSSTFIRNSSILDNIVESVENEGKELGAFNSFYPKPFHIELGFLVSHPHSLFIYKLLKEMDYCLEIGVRKYMEKRINEGVKIYSRIIYDKKKPNKNKYNLFFCFYVSIQSVVQKEYNKNPPIFLLDSEDYLYKLQIECKWHADCMYDKFWNDEDNQKYPMVVFTTKTRGKIEFPKIDII